VSFLYGVLLQIRYLRVYCYRWVDTSVDGLLLRVYCYRWVDTSVDGLLLRVYCYRWVDTSVDGLLVTNGIICQVVSVSTLTWFIGYIY
jgi:predicted DNA-binding ribbon-helix-helix protein